MQIKILIRSAVLLMLLFVAAGTSQAQSGGTHPQSAQSQASPASSDSGGSNQVMQPSDAAWIISILDRYLFPVLLILFGALVIFVQYKYLVSAKPNPDVSLPAFSLTLIITGTLVLVSLNSNSQVLGTVVGLFGTIAGYVLGRSVSRKPPQQPDAD